MSTITMTLYKKSKTGKVQQWTIEIKENKFRTIEGFIDGAQTPTEWTVCDGKRKGMANETTPAQQARKEAEAKFKKQKDKGWAAHLADIEKAERKTAPMLAHKWEDHKDKVIPELAQGDVYFSQPKLDGIRCEGEIDKLSTRNGKPILSAPHILYTIETILKSLDMQIILDGELYNHDLKNDFNEITSIVRKQKPTSADIEKAEQLLQYHIYDIQLPEHPEMTFESRQKFIRRFIPAKSPLVLVQTDYIEDIAHMDKLYGEYLEQGYEGQMVRKGSSVYQNFRSKDLLKRKEFEDKEFVIVDIEEGKGNRSGMMGRIKFDGFDANARGSHDFFKELLINKRKYIGQKATVRYQNLTPDGKPRFPVVVAIRDYE